MTATNGWPGKPGVPMHPEKDGRHWLIRVNGQYPEVWEWASGPDGWCAEYGDKGIGAWCESEGAGHPKEIAKWYHYLGPALTPDEATALQKRVAELETALQFIKDAPAPNWNNMGSYEAGLRYCAGFARAALEGGKDE